MKLISANIHQKELLRLSQRIATLKRNGCKNTLVHAITPILKKIKKEYWEAITPLPIIHPSILNLAHWMISKSL